MKNLVIFLTISLFIFDKIGAEGDQIKQINNDDDSNLDGPNVCKKVVQYPVEVTVSEKQSYQERLNAWCWNVPPRCSKYKIKVRTVQKTQILIKSRIIKDCCDGYFKVKNVNNTKCIAICTKGCTHGNCVAPEQCKCENGYGGPVCDISK
jgi:multiple epidermal growth factor-like domains protein 10/11